MPKTKGLLSETFNEFEKKEFYKLDIELFAKGQMQEIIHLERIEVPKVSGKWGVLGYLNNWSGIIYCHITKNYASGQIYRLYPERIAISRVALNQLEKKKCKFLLFNYLNYLDKTGNNLFLIVPIEVMKKGKLIDDADYQHCIKFNDVKNSIFYTNDLSYILDEMVRLNYKLKKEDLTNEKNL